jgi:riboflavin synthase
MFTGLVEGMGTIVEVVCEGPGSRICIATPPELVPGTSIGDSVAVNGCCLTIINVQEDRWIFEAGPETLARTNLGGLRRGERVNLERALPADARLGGHFVQGHIDGCGVLERIDRDGPWAMLWFGAERALTAQMVSKGSVAVDGVSLTLVDVEDQRFSVALIPHTLEVTTLGARHVSDRVNIETDILAKYVEKLLKR